MAFTFPNPTTDLINDIIKKWKVEKKGYYPYNLIDSFNTITSLNDIFKHYLPSMKNDLAILNDQFKENNLNINIYEKALHWHIGIGQNPHYQVIKNQEIFDLIEFGISQNQIDLKNNKNYEIVKNIFAEKLIKPSKTRNKTKFSILVHLIKENSDNIKYLYGFVHNNNEKYTMNVKERISLKEYVESLPQEEIKKYPSLKSFWMDLEISNELEESEPQVYNIKINLVKTSQKHQIPLKEVQTLLTDNLDKLHNLLIHNMFMKSVPIMDSLKKLRRISKVNVDNKEEKIEIDYLSNDIDSHIKNKELISSIIKQILENPRVKYSVGEMEELLETQATYFNIQNKIESKNIVNKKQTKKKL